MDNNGKELSGFKVAEGREYINLLFKVEEEIKDLSYGEKKQKRQEASRPILDAFWAWVEETSALATTNEKLTQALGYSKNQKEYLETFLEDRTLLISNNLCEANIKPFATAGFLYNKSQILIVRPLKMYTGISSSKEYIFASSSSSKM